VVAVDNTADAVARVAIPHLRYGHAHIPDGDSEPARVGPRSWLRQWRADVCIDEKRLATAAG